MSMEEELIQQQTRRDLIKSLLEFKEFEETQGEESITASTNQIDNSALEARIKQFNLQQIQEQQATVYKTMLCRYNSNKIAQFLCCSQYCDNHAVMCGEQTCKCTLDHSRCNFRSIKSLIDQISAKIQQHIPKQIELYFQVKSVIYEHMLNRISQERQALMDWQRDSDNNSSLFLYIYKVGQAIVCNAPKVVYNKKIHFSHEKCCTPLQINKKQIGEEQIIKIICKIIHKKYQSLIEYLDQKLIQIQYRKKYANLNSAQFIFIEFLKNMNNFEGIEFYSDEGLNGIKILAGHTIYLAQKCNKKQLRNIDFEKFSLNRIRRIWKEFSQKQFRSLVEGKAMNELFCKMNKLGSQNVQSAQVLRSQIDKIMQSISQEQEYLFSKSILTKKLVLKNLQQEQLRSNEAQISDNKEISVKYRDVKFDQVYISNDRNQTALNRVETIRGLSNLQNVRKLQIKWCQQMTEQVSMEILNTMPNLKQLALLNHSQKFSKYFMKKLNQFKQLTQFYINPISHPEYYRSFKKDQNFISLNSSIEYNLQQIKELVELSKLPKLENIQINFVNAEECTQIIKNMKSLRHLTLGYKNSRDDEIDVGLMKQLHQKTTLITLSLIGIKIESKKFDEIIIKNLHLKTIIIINSHHNENMNDKTVECMANLIELQNLCISKNTAITGIHLSKLDKLIMLQISYCPNVNKKQMTDALMKMCKLQHLYINGNKWFDNEVLESIQSCKQVKHLNIQGTSVSSEGVKYLEGLTRLKTLICAKINGDSLIQLTKKTSKITRLSLCKLDVGDNEILKISANCPELTHLNTKGTKITVQALIKIGKLKAARVI